MINRRFSRRFSQFSRQSSLQHIFSCFFPGLILIVAPNTAQAISITWVAQGSNNDMNNPASWDPNTVPGTNDIANFDNTIPGINTQPTENSAPFSLSAFHFLNTASVFNFNFNNHTLTFNGAGITGTTSANTNPTITVTNTNNTLVLGDLVAFLAGTSTSGSASLTSINSSTLAGSHSSTGIGYIQSNVHASGAFTLADTASITASNTGQDSASGTGNNGVANILSSQLQFDQSFTAGNNVAISASNSGTFSGTNTIVNDTVAAINGSQFSTAGAFQAGDNFNLDVENTGNDSGHGVNTNFIGEINAAQVNLQTTATVGNNCTITVSNTGINSSPSLNSSDFIGYLNDEQFFVGNTFQAGDNFSLTATNTGTDTSTGHGTAQVAFINSNSGTTGNQILFNQGGLLGKNATISAVNSGTYSGSNTNGGSNVAGMNLGQIAIGDRTAPGSYTFVAGDGFSLSASNSGTDSSNGVGTDAVGTVSSDQVTFFSPVTLGNRASITLTNSGDYSGNASTVYVNVGSAGHSQLNCASTFSAGDAFTLSATNSGTNTGTGVGGYFIGDLVTGQQVEFQQNLTLGNNASITISNSGSNSSNTTHQNQVGSLMGYGKQFLALQQVLIGDNFLLGITNTGFDNSTGAGGNYVGFINNTAADGTASQCHLETGATIGNRASITLTNTGTYQGSNTENLISVLAGQQFDSAGAFYAGDEFALTVSNSGINNASGQNNNRIGTVGNPQVEFDDVCVIGNNSAILLSNSGVNNDATGTSNNVGLINCSQLRADKDFTAGTSLSMTATNAGTNAGDSSNVVGYISDSQLFFAQNCTLGDGSSISAFNSGTVENSQIVFGQGFNVASGRVTIQAVNSGTVGSFGIDVQGNNAGGDAHIILGNSSLYIETTLPTFTIGGLDGDSTSFAQSQPQLIIYTDASTRSTFSGSLQNFPATSSTLMKTGAGTQVLSGVNTYTGLTTIQEGVLVVNGSLVGNVVTNSLGTLKGNGSIGGTLTNMGTVAPGESIGTLTLGTYIENNGTYAVEVNGLGQSDLIDVLGTATLNGGTVFVSSADGTYRFQQPYTIVSAEEGVFGRYNNVTTLAFIKPLLTYDPNHVYLSLQSDLTRAAKKCNQIGVASILDAIPHPNAAQSLLISGIANLPLAQAQKALESLSGFQYTHDSLITEIATSRLLRRLYDPLRPLVTACDACEIYRTCSPYDVHCCNRCMTWLETGYGLTNSRGHHDSNAHKLDLNSYQVTGGFQKTFCHNFTIGLAGSYEYDNVKYHDGKASRNTEFVSAYGLYRPHKFYGLFDLVYGHSSNHLRRTIHIGNLHDHISSKSNFNLFTFYGEAGFDCKVRCVLLQPFLGIQTGKNWRGPIHEHQDCGFGLRFKKHDWTLTRSRLGLHLSTCHVHCLDASFDVAWNKLWSGRRNGAIARFRQFGDAFRICGNRLDNDSFDYALTLKTSLCLCNRWKGLPGRELKGYVRVGGEVWQHVNTFEALAGVMLCW